MILATRYRIVTLIEYFFGFDNLRRKLTGGRRDLEVVAPISEVRQECCDLTTSFWRDPYCGFYFDSQTWSS